MQLSTRVRGDTSAWREVLTVLTVLTVGNQRAAKGGGATYGATELDSDMTDGSELVTPSDSDAVCSSVPLLQLPGGPSVEASDAEYWRASSPRGSTIFGKLSLCMSFALEPGCWRLAAPAPSSASAFAS